MTLQAWLRRREYGFRKRIGDEDSFYKSLYSSIAPQLTWPDDNSLDSPNFGGIFGLEFSLDGAILVAACEKKSVILFDSLTRKPLKILENSHQDCVNCVKFLDDKQFATCSDDSTVALYDIRNLKQKVKVLRGHSNWVKNIEYCKKDNLLVTSGFDGSIFTWNLNDFSENSLIYNKIFHTPGLMRCRLSHDSSKLVICTTGGYLIIIHDLDLQTLARDLAGFRPNLYRLMQVRKQYLPVTAKYESLFNKSTKTNRVELVSDFPKGNEAEVVSSLQIHPQGWCALSRNISYDESSEWTTVHDIQSIDSDSEDSLSENIVDDQITRMIMRHRMGPVRPIEENVSIMGDNGAQVAPPAPQHLNLRVSVANQASLVSATDSPPRVVLRVERRAIPSNNNNELGEAPPQPARELPREPVLDLWSGNIAYSQRTQRTPSDRPYRINSGILTTPARFGRTNPNIKQNKKRLLHYIEEPNQSKGFIKELCFSTDGRFICSPYACGIRILAFDEQGRELPYSLSSTGEPQKLQQIQCIEKHSEIVVSTKFSPRVPIVVSGCLQGKILWNQPLF